MSDNNPFNDRDATPAESVYPMTSVRSILSSKLVSKQFPDWTLGTANTASNNLVERDYDSDCVPFSSLELFSNFIAKEMTKAVFDLTYDNGFNGGLHRAHVRLSQQNKYQYPKAEELNQTLRRYIWIVTSDSVAQQLITVPTETRVLYNDYSLIGTLDTSNDPSHRKVSPVKVWHGEVQRLSPSPTYVWVDSTLPPDNDMIYCMCEDVFDLAYTISQTTFTPLENGQWRLAMPFYLTSLMIDGIKVTL